MQDIEIFSWNWNYKKTYLINLVWRKIKGFIKQLWFREIFWKQILAGNPRTSTEITNFTSEKWAFLIRNQWNTRIFLNKRLEKTIAELYSNVSMNSFRRMRSRRRVKSPQFPLNLRSKIQSSKPPNVLERIKVKDSHANGVICFSFRIKRPKLTKEVFAKAIEEPLNAWNAILEVATEVEFWFTKPEFMVLNELTYKEKTTQIWFTRCINVPFACSAKAQTKKGVRAHVAEFHEAPEAEKMDFDLKRV